MLDRLTTDPLTLFLAVALLAVMLAWLFSIAGARHRQADMGARLADLRRDTETRLAEARAAQNEVTRRHGEAVEARGTALSEAATLREAVSRLEQAMEKATADMARLQARHEGLQKEHGELQTRHARISTDQEGKLATAELRIVELKEMRAELTRNFRELAGETLRVTGKEFTETNLTTLGELLKPFRAEVGKFEEELKRTHDAAQKERIQLVSQIEGLSKSSAKMREDAEALTRALKGDRQKQGAWGEMILERILEESGLTRGRDYLTQSTHKAEDGSRYRPDVIVQLPLDKVLVIDSKVSLSAYEEAMRADTAGDEVVRDAALRRHHLAVKTHIDQLSRKGYEDLDRRSVDYVLLFMPIEGALAAAWTNGDDIVVYAADRRIALVTPTTLMMALKTVNHIWMVERRESNAEVIAERAGKLHDKLVLFVENLEKVGKFLGQAQDAHGEAVKQLSTGQGNALNQIDTLRRMGAKVKKALPADSFESHSGDDDAAIALEQVP